MPLALTDTFNSIQLKWTSGSNYITFINWVKTDETFGVVVFNLQDGGMSIVNGEDLDILQQIWATDDKFVDENDVMKLYLLLCLVHLRRPPKSIRT